MSFLALAFCLGAMPPVGDEPKPQPMPTVRTEDELADLRAQIAHDMQIVEKKLQSGDAGDDTRDLQKRVVENLDKLLKKLQEPPSGDSSPKSESSPQPSSGTPKGGSSNSASSRRERREAQRRQQQTRGGAPRQQAASQPQAGSGRPNDPSGMTGRPTARGGPPDSFADVAKDVWGHLPESLRQEVDHYYREQFMPRYRDLLQQYYLRLAESERRPRSNP